MNHELSRGHKSSLGSPITWAWRSSVELPHFQQSLSYHPYLVSNSPLLWLVMREFWRVYATHRYETFKAGKPTCTDGKRWESPLPINKDALPYFMLCIELMEVMSREIGRKRAQMICSPLSRPWPRGMNGQRSSRFYQALTPHRKAASSGISQLGIDPNMKSHRVIAYREARTGSWPWLCSNGSDQMFRPELSNGQCAYLFGRLCIRSDLIVYMLSRSIGAIGISFLASLTIDIRVISHGDE